MISYNHEKYIQAAIEGVLMQETDFEYELIISNDRSTDQTDAVVNECIRSHPKGNQIRYFSHDQNLGMMPNFIFSLQECCGDFIALCEGDDYWTDPQKLQKQVNYLIDNKNCNLVFTDVQLYIQAENKYEPNWASIHKDRYEFSDLAKGNIITTCTVLFRRPPVFKELQEWLKHFKVGDYPLYMFLLRSGYARYINDITSVYRQHSAGVFSLLGPVNFINTNIEVLKQLLVLDTNKQHRLIIKNSLVQWYYTKAVRLASDGNSKIVRTFIKQKLKILDVFYNSKAFFKLIILFAYPGAKKNVFK